MKWIDLYLEEVRHHLPSQNREDIVREIRSTLLDMVEDHNPNPGQPPSEELVKDVLKDFGSPRKIAREYGSHQYLIGPRMYPVYIQVLKIVLIIVLAMNVLGLLITVVNPPNLAGGILITVLELVGGLFTSMFTAFGIVTLSFALIEKSAPESWHAEFQQSWSPEDLPKTIQQEHVKVPGLAVEITLAFVFIALLNFFFDRIGIYYLGETGWVSAPILNDQFRRYIPWLTAAAVTDIGLNLYLIRQGIWDRLATAGRVLINLFKIGILSAIILGPAVITISPVAWQALDLTLDFGPDELSRTLNTLLNVLLGLTMFGLVVDTIKRIASIFFRGDKAQTTIIN